MLVIDEPTCLLLFVRPVPDVHDDDGVLVTLTRQGADESPLVGRPRPQPPHSRARSARHHDDARHAAEPVPEAQPKKIGHRGRRHVRD